MVSSGVAGAFVEKYCESNPWKNFLIVNVFVIHLASGRGFRTYLAFVDSRFIKFATWILESVFLMPYDFIRAGVRCLQNENL